jgi:hypothetical protein
MQSSKVLLGNPADQRGRAGPNQPAEKTSNNAQCQKIGTTLNSRQHGLERTNRRIKKKTPVSAGLQQTIMRTTSEVDAENR